MKSPSAGAVPRWRDGRWRSHRLHGPYIPLGPARGGKRRASRGPAASTFLQVEAPDIPRRKRRSAGVRRPAVPRIAGNGRPPGATRAEPAPDHPPEAILSKAGTEPHPLRRPPLPAVRGGGPGGGWPLLGPPPPGTGREPRPWPAARRPREVLGRTREPPAPSPSSRETCGARCTPAPTSRPSAGPPSEVRMILACLRIECRRTLRHTGFPGQAGKNSRGVAPASPVNHAGGAGARQDERATR